jgi:uncharacterized protein YjbJ (UPF0337 family)
MDSRARDGRSRTWHGVPEAPDPPVRDRRRIPVSDGTGEKMKGVAKETVGKVTGSEEMRAAGEQQQKKAQKDEEARRLQEEAETKKREAAGHLGHQRRNEG